MKRYEPYLRYVLLSRDVNKTSGSSYVSWRYVASLHNVNKTSGSSNVVTLRDTYAVNGLAKDSSVRSPPHWPHGTVDEQPKTS